MQLLRDNLTLWTSDMQVGTASPNHHPPPPPLPPPCTHLQGWGRTISVVTIFEVATVEMVHAEACCAYLLELLSIHACMHAVLSAPSPPVCRN